MRKDYVYDVFWEREINVIVGLSTRCILDLPIYYVKRVDGAVF